MRFNARQTRIALPSKGRLNEPCVELLKAAGISFRRRDRALMAHAKGLDLMVLFVRPDDIPILVAEGAADLGVVGRDLVTERGCDRRVKHLLDLNFGHCRLAVAVKERAGIKTIKNLKGKRIAASMSHTAKLYFKRKKVPVNILEVSGSVEIMVALGMADAIVDLVESGDTLRDNGLTVIETISNSEAVLISSSKVRDKKLCHLIQRRLQGVLTARQYTLLEYNIRKKSLKDGERIAPGFESPTVSDLEDPRWSAVKVMVPKNRSIEIIDQLEAIGATAILETAIHNCRL